MVDQPANPEPTKAPRGTTQKKAQTIVILTAILIATGPLAYSFGRREMARWYLAAGFERLLQDDLDGAIAKIDRAIAWNPRDANLIMKRASWKMRRGNLDTVLADCDLALQLARGEFASRRSNDSQIALALALNQRAYAFALAGSNLEEALQNVQEALGIVGNDYNVLDTRGYLQLKLGNLVEAQRDLEAALRMAEESYKEQRSSLRKRGREMVDKRPITDSERSLTDGLAVLTHHRGELYEQLGQEEDAIRDLRRAKQLGYAPQDGVW